MPQRKTEENNQRIASEKAYDSTSYVTEFAQQLIADFGVDAWQKAFKGKLLSREFSSLKKARASAGFPSTLGVHYVAQQAVATMVKGMWIHLPRITPDEMAQKDLVATSQQEEFTMDNIGTILEKLDHISRQHQDDLHSLKTDIHHLESRINGQLTDLKNSFSEFRRDTREEVQEIRLSVKAVERSNKGIIVAILVAGFGIVIATYVALYYGTWTIFSTIISVMTGLF